MTDVMPFGGGLSTSRGQSSEGTSDSNPLDSIVPNSSPNGTHRDIPLDPQGIAYDGDFFSESGLASPEEQPTRRIPTIGGLTRADAARAYMDADIAIFPVDGKMPIKVMTGRMRWAEESTTDLVQHVKWCKAIWFPGADHLTHRRGMAIDCGKSGVVVMDVDRPELVPNAWWPILESAPFTSTDTEDPRRGHYYFAQPAQQIGCPKGEWGEIKGAGGYVVLPPSPHAAAHLDWPDNQTPEKKHRPTARYLQVRAGGLRPLPALIADAFGAHRAAKAAASYEQVAVFMQQFGGGREGTDPRLLDQIIRRFLSAVDRNEGRHPSMIDALCWATKAAHGGLIDAELAHDTLESVFSKVKGAEATPTEFEDMWEWAIGQATEEEVADYLARRAKKAAERQSSGVSQAVEAATSVVEDGTWSALAEPHAAEVPVQRAPSAEEDGQAAGKIPGLIPEEVWAKREILQHIRQAAHSRCASGDVALYATLTRLSAMLDHRIVADVGQGHAPLNLFCGIVDNSGGGKSTGVDVSNDLLVMPNRDFLDDVTASTGEGITESFLGMVGTGEFHEKGPHKGEEKMERGQVRHNAFFSIDEGQALINQGKKANSILWPIVRSAWKSGTLSQQNATEDRKRKVTRLTYVMGLLVAFQEPNALEVLRDDETGTAQRFIWCQGSDPAIPRRRSQAPAHPGTLAHNPQLIEVPQGRVRIISFPDDICDQLWEEQAARKAGELVVDKLDSHANLMKMKLAALMALLDMGRDRVTHEDWWLAEKLYEASCELRGDVLRKAAVAEREAAEARRTEQVVTEAAKHAAKSDMDDKILSVARWMYNRVKDGKCVHPKLGKPTFGQLKQDAPGRNSKYLNSAFQKAESMGWLVIVDEETTEIAVGNSKPA